MSYQGRRTWPHRRGIGAASRRVRRAVLGIAAVSKGVAVLTAFSVSLAHIMHAAVVIVL